MAKVVAVTVDDETSVRFAEGRAAAEEFIRLPGNG